MSDGGGCAKGRATKLRSQGVRLSVCLSLVLAAVWLAEPPDALSLRSLLPALVVTCRLRHAAKYRTCGALVCW